MRINQTINNGIDGFEITEDNGTVSFVQAGSESEAVAKLNRHNELKAIPLKQDYKILRARAYPDFREYLDAKVKQSSSDLSIVQEGSEQEKKYLSDCLKVKEGIPKN